MILNVFADELGNDFHNRAPRLHPFLGQARQPERTAVKRAKTTLTTSRHTFTDLPLQRFKMCPGGLEHRSYGRVSIPSGWQGAFGASRPVHCEICTCLHPRQDSSESRKPQVWRWCHLPDLSQPSRQFLCRWHEVLTACSAGATSSRDTTAAKTSAAGPPPKAATRKGPAWESQHNTTPTGTAAPNEQSLPKLPTSNSRPRSRQAHNAASV